MIRLWASLFALVVVAAPAPAPVRADKTIEFGGLLWQVRAQDLAGPGPNDWSADNVWVDSQKRLHLKITPPARAGGLWQCAEIYTGEKFGFGRYQWRIAGRPDGFDPQVVLGLFNYPAPATNPDGTNEIDIEFSRWGHAQYPNGNYTIWPAVPNNGDKLSTSLSKTFEFKLKQAASVHRFDWSARGVEFWSRDGAGESGAVVGHWKYISPAPKQEIPQQPLPLHLNLWLAEGKAPQNGKPVEITISDFSFVPAPK